MSSEPEPHVALRVQCDDELTRELAAAAAFEAGAAGTSEERDGELTVYASRSHAALVMSALREAIGAAGRVAEPEEIADREWSEEWKRHLEILEVSPRLRVRPAVLDAPLPEGMCEVVIEPGQAFGLGGHESTRLALEWVDALASSDACAGRSCQWLDVGTGTGVLALAALCLGASRAVGCDIDPLATEAAEHAARTAGFEDRFAVRLGSLEALEPGAFERVVANLLKREVLPLADAIADRAKPGGRIALAGLLDRDEAEVLDRFAEAGCRPAPEGARRELVDADGARWVGLLLERVDGS